MSIITNINMFKSKLNSGGVRPTQFYITNAFPPDSGLIGPPNSAEISDISYMAKAASIPEEIISAISVGYQGRKIKLAGDRTYRDWNVTIINDVLFSLRKRFEFWNTLLNHPEENIRDEEFMLPNNYKTDLIVNQLTQNGTIATRYFLRGAWPTRISDIKLSWDDQNTIEEFDVTFSYDYFVTDTTPGVKLET